VISDCGIYGICLQVEIVYICASLKEDYTKIKNIIVERIGKPPLDYS
jgi:hypothetical protein